MASKETLIWYEKVRQLYFDQPDCISEELEQEALYLAWKDELIKMRSVQELLN